MTRNKLYIIIMSACLAGVIWVVWNQTYHQPDSIQPFCVFHRVTTLPCPACGTTRATVLLMQGRICDAVQTNPFSIVTTLIVLIAPLWILFDLTTKRSTLYNRYRLMEHHLSQKIIAIPLIIMVIIVWIHNIVNAI